MSYRTDDTIAAIASAAGGAMRGIIRMSGPDVLDCLDRCFRSDGPLPWRRLRHACVVAGELMVGPPVGDLPCDLFVWPTDRSYTRQPAAEIHTFGSPPLLDAALRTVCAAGARLAEPGEFTMRAFLAGRLDLTQAEAVLGVVDAENRRELDVALSQLAGGIAQPLNALRERLLELLAHVEAGLDFVDEDIEFITPQQLQQQLSGAAEAVAAIADQMSHRARAGGEARVVLVGWPNVGKSSLLNALAGDDAAIVSPTAGTTRDYVARKVVCDGVNCLLIDTAGVEKSPPGGGIGQAAQALASEQIQLAHLQLLCLDAARPLNAWERSQLQCEQGSRLLVLTKIDAGRISDLDRAAIETSSWTGEGLSALRTAIAQRIAGCSAAAGNVVPNTAARCTESLRLASESIGRARDLAAEQRGEELVAHELRVSLDELGKIVGAVYTEDVLDRIFSRFCVGK